jgi:ATPase subunit of ABC transporter with duplicated ATPase domains
LVYCSQTFIIRFSANASKSKQATSRLKQLDKIVLDDMRPSSRVSPYIDFKQDKTLHRNLIEVEGLSKSFGDLSVLKDINFIFEVGQRVAIIGQNGVGKTTLLRTLIGEINFNKIAMQCFVLFKINIRTNSR